jgi:hypothetical protein
MIRTVVVTVTYPLTFQLTLDTAEDLATARMRVINQADQLFESALIEPVITECTGFPELVS